MGTGREAIWARYCAEAGARRAAALQVELTAAERDLDALMETWTSATEALESL